MDAQCARIEGVHACQAGDLTIKVVACLDQLLLNDGIGGHAMLRGAAFGRRLCERLRRGIRGVVHLQGATGLRYSAAMAVV